MWLTLAKDRDDKGRPFRTVTVNMSSVMAVIPCHDTPDFCELVFGISEDGEPKIMTINHSADSIMACIGEHYDMSARKQ